MTVSAVFLRFVLAAVLFLASVAKLPRLNDFEEAVRRFAIVPAPLVRPFASTVAVLELLLSVALFVGIGLREAVIACALLFVLFNLATSVNLRRGRRFDCGCGAVGASDQIGVSLIVRNFGLAGAAVFVAIVDPTAFALDSALGGSSSHLSSGDSFGLLAIAVLAVLATELGYSLRVAWQRLATHKAVDA